MRIIAGKYKGQRLKAVPGMGTRPTSDKVKGAIFNVLREKVEKARVLDLFAGTGNLAIEALSQGAREAVLVEKDSKAQAVIRANLDRIGVSDATLMKMDAFGFLRHGKDEIFDLIFLDPPYHGQFAHKALLALTNPCRLSDHGVIVVETAKDEVLPDIPLFEVRKTSEYGDTKIWYLQRTTSNQASLLELQNLMYPI